MIGDYKVERIEHKDTKDFILNKHYAKRMPSISYAFGLIQDGSLQGVLTIGKPASNSLCEGVCGKEYKSQVYELNRLVVNDGLPKNTLSYFVGKSLKELKNEDLIIVSYADEGANHHGYIYQATNWIYTGKTKGRTDKYVPNGKHSRHYTNENNHIRKVRTPKHRYIYFTNRKRIDEYMRLLKYPIIKQYPKGDNERYTLGERIGDKVINTQTGETWYE